MAAKEFAIRLSVEKANEVRSALKGMGADGAAALRTFGDAADRAGREVGGMRAEAVKAGPALNGLSSATGALKGHLTALIGIGAIAAIGKEAIQAADKFSSMRSRLALVVREGESLLKVERDLGAASIQNNSDLEGTVSLYARLRNARKDLTDATAQKAVDSWNKTLIVSGSSAAEAASATLQFAQGMGAGALQGAELGAVLEGNIRGAQLLADALGVSLGELKKLGAEGKINTAVILKALTQDTERLKKEFDAIALTTDKAGTNMDTAWVRAVGAIDDATHASAALAAGLNWVAESVNDLTSGTAAAQSPIKRMEEALAKAEKQVLATDRAVGKAGFGPFAASVRSTLGPLTEFEQKLADVQQQMVETGQAARNALIGEMSLTRRAIADEVDGVKAKLAELNTQRERRLAVGMSIPKEWDASIASMESQLKTVKAAQDASLKRIYEILQTPSAEFRDKGMLQESVTKWGKIVEGARTPVEQARAALAAFNKEAAKFPEIAEWAAPARAVLVKALADATAASKEAKAATKEESNAVKEAAEAVKRW